MKNNSRIAVTITAFAAMACFAKAAEPKLVESHPPAGYKLVWVDEFNGNKLDETKWMYRTDVKVSSSQRPDNVTVEGGNLVLHMRKANDRGKNYTGSGVISRQRFRYGYYEARVKMFGGSGWHQSVWSLAASDGSTTFPQSSRTEIDGMEFDSANPAKGHMGLIMWDGPKQRGSRTCSPGVPWAMLGVNAPEGFHTFGYDWTEKKIRYYFDGDLRCVLDYTTDDGEHDEINFWLTALGYEVAGMKIDDAKLPGKMLVDFAAFYAK